MQYLSTRGHPERRRFCEILLEGLAPDGGLYLPETYPRVDADTLARWRAVYSASGYADLAFEILSLYIDDIPSDDLRAICRKTYTEEVFGSKEIVPLKQLQPGLYLEALSNGPTLAFKDMAMQLLGNLFEYELARRGEELNILGATSGDTGSAAEYAMRGKKGVRVFMTSPHGRMSPFQQAQMFSLMDENIHNIAVDGVFDDCQDMVKAVSNDLAFKRQYKIGTVNSINWARLMAQVVYYFAGYFQATSSDSAQFSDGPPLGKLVPSGGSVVREATSVGAQLVSFAVPSGNFGNVCATSAGMRMTRLGRASMPTKRAGRSGSRPRASTMVAANLIGSAVSSTIIGTPGCRCSRATFRPSAVWVSISTPNSLKVLRIVARRSAWLLLPLLKP